MSGSFWLVQVLNGISLGMLLFVISAGLSLVFGLMRVLNLAHGSFFLLGGYLGLVAIRATGNFYAGLLAASLAVAAIGLVVERLLIAKVYGDELRQAMLTFGLMFVIADLALWQWGGNPMSVPKPELFSESVRLFDFVFPNYRLFLIAAGSAMALGLWWLQERTVIGARIRACVDDREMTSAMGVDVRWLFAGAFAFGALLAGLGGVLAGPVLGVQQGVDLHVLLLSFVVIMVGGLGTLKGALFGGIAVGLLDNFGRALFPELAQFTIFLPMAVILIVRPQGLFGR